MEILNDIRRLLLAMWLGAAIFFSAIVAPSIFAILREFQQPNTNEVAGAIVNRALGAVNVSGVIISIVLMLTAFVLKRGLAKGSLVLELFFLSVTATATGLGQWVIAARMRGLRTTIALPFDQIPAADPRRVAFNTLHTYSVTALAIAMIAALIAFLVMGYRARVN